MHFRIFKVIATSGFLTALYSALNSFSVGAPPGARWGSLQRPPRPTNWFKGDPTSKWKWREGKGKVRKGDKGRKEKGRGEKGRQISGSALHRMSFVNDVIRYSAACTAAVAAAIVVRLSMVYTTVVAWLRWCCHWQITDSAQSADDAARVMYVSIKVDCWINLFLHQTSSLCRLSKPYPKSCCESCWSFLSHHTMSDNCHWL